MHGAKSQAAKIRPTWARRAIPRRGEWWRRAWLRWAEMAVEGGPELPRGAAVRLDDERDRTAALARGEIEERRDLPPVKAAVADQ